MVCASPLARASWCPLPAVVLEAASTAWTHGSCGAHHRPLLLPAPTRSALPGQCVSVFRATWPAQALTPRGAFGVTQMEHPGWP